MQDNKRVKTSMDLLYESIVEEERQAQRRQENKEAAERLRRRMDADDAILRYNEELIQRAEGQVKIRERRIVQIVGPLIPDTKPYVPVFRHTPGFPRYTQEETQAAAKTFHEKVKRARAPYGDSSLFLSKFGNVIKKPKTGFYPGKVMAIIQWPDGQNWTFPRSRSLQGSIMSPCIVIKPWNQL